MKRLLAAGSGSIYQICKTFRNAETGVRHNPEFTMLEWYRLNFSLDDLMLEVEELILSSLNLCCEPFQKISYREVFEEYLGINPFTVSKDELIRLAEQEAGFIVSKVDSLTLSRDDYLNALLSICIESKLGKPKGDTLKPVFLYAYPPSQASLAKLTYDEKGEHIAERFELYINGLEIANGYFELTDAVEQRSRFEEDNYQREELGLPLIPYDEHLLSALNSGLPECSGVALGLDRLLMVKLKAKSIEEVISFPITRA
jgi:lysyl-tRNA synthetase class 2